MKKFIYLALISILVVFSGCGQEKQAVKNKPNLQPTPSAQPVETESTAQLPLTNAAPVSSEFASLSNQVFGFGFKKSPKGTVPSLGAYEKYMTGNSALYVGPTDQKNIYLTFDEGYENGYTAKILDVLKEKNAPAAFFCTGDYVTRNTDLVKRMVEEGHIVGNHTWNHPTLPNVTDENRFKSELTKIDDFMMEKFGQKTIYFRYPNGEFSARSLKMVQALGYKTVFWSLAYKDWERDVVKGTDFAVGEVVNHIHNGAIILLHAVSQDNALALPIIIDQLRAEGYHFASLDQLNFD